MPNIMIHVYVLSNQHQQFLSKSGEWLDGREPSRLFRSEHKDIAINQMFEANTRDVSLRIELLQCDLNNKGQPLIPAEALAAVSGTSPQGEPEIPPAAPEEVPPQRNPELNPQPEPEVAPEQAPEVAPEPAPEETPAQPDERRSKSESTA
ncbi:hypothetical protein [Microbulbifer spongiae]|uniref:DUF3391 domain-containing protein n=1 Tax=Microbulbifer spongiae TaxID=2944933 RepID=A0ABY9EBG4_9GAMM|nr:hypothetical protein [Microbulbifer sp. MI-G]WKD49637.1 hypothetical protein M8T91_17370 [Microbulbifer sp. MI-G]